MLATTKPPPFWHVWGLFCLTAVSLATLFAYKGGVAWRESRGFWAYYTAAYVLIYRPDDAYRMYERLEFNELMAETGFPGISDTFAPNLPTTALMLLPLLPLPLEVATALYFLLMMVAWVVGLVILASALHLPWQWGVWFAAAGWFYAPLHANLYRGQVYIYLFVGVCALFWFYSRQKESWAGLVAGLLFTIKSAGVWLLLLWGLTGRWRAVGVAGLTFMALVVLTWPLTGLAMWQTYGQKLPQYLGIYYPPVTAIQSLTGLFQQWFTYDAVWNPTPITNWPSVVLPLRLLVFGLSLAVTVYVAWPRTHTQPLLWLAFLNALVVTNAPAAEDYHYLLILPSFVVAGWWAWQQRLPWRLSWPLWLAWGLVGLPLPFTTPMLSQGWWAVLAFPRIYGAFLLWGWLGWQVRSNRSFPGELVAER